jgi:hypothetical protein
VKINKTKVEYLPNNFILLINLIDLNLRGINYDITDLINNKKSLKNLTLDKCDRLILLKIFPGSNIENLTLNNNKLSIEKDVFSQLSSLKRLKLNYN